MIEFPLPTWTAPLIGVLVGEAVGYCIWWARGRPEMWAQASVCWWPVRVWKRWRAPPDPNEWVRVPLSSSAFSRLCAYRQSIIYHVNHVALWEDEDASGMRDHTQYIYEARRWLLDDLKALGTTECARRAEMRLRARQGTLMDPLTYTLDDINAHLNMPPGDTRMKAAVDSGLVQGRDVYYVLSSCWARLGMSSHAYQYKQMSDAFQDSLVNASVYGGPVVQQQLAQALMYGNSAAAYAAPARSGRVTARRPDPVSDPYLAAHDFAEELGAHLGLEPTALGLLPVKAYMLWVSIRAAQKDDLAWEDLDARLHEIAGVPYVSAAERRAQELAPVAGALYLAEWATHTRGDYYRLYMLPCADKDAFIVSAEDVVDLGLDARLRDLLAKAPSAVTYDVDYDVANDRLLISDGKNRRWVPVTDHRGSIRVRGYSQAELLRLWTQATPVAPMYRIDCLSEDVYLLRPDDGSAPPRTVTRSVLDLGVDISGSMAMLDWDKVWEHADPLPAGLTADDLCAASRPRAMLQHFAQVMSNPNHWVNTGLVGGDYHPRAQLKFVCQRANAAYPKFSLVFRDKLLWLLELEDPPLKHPHYNPPWAKNLGLPAKVSGSHAHTWPNNRDHVLNHAAPPEWELPAREPLNPKIQRLPQALADFASAVNLVLESDQRLFDVPPQSEMF